MAVTASARDEAGSMASELYPVALRQARFEALMNVATWVGWAAFCVVAIRNGFMAVCGATLLISGVAQTARAIKWWRWLKRATPEQALPRLLP
jgi:uncharacterized protein involved in response to NO